jgi:hypothetical protein
MPQSLESRGESATIVSFRHSWVAPFALALAAIAAAGCCQPKERSATFHLEREVGQDCPSRDAAEGPLRDHYGSAFGSVDGEPTPRLVATFARCCYEVSYSLDQTSSSSRECLGVDASPDDPTAIPACPAGADAVSKLAQEIRYAHATANGLPAVSGVVVNQGPELDMTRDAYVDCAYPGTRLDSADVCG